MKVFKFHPPYKPNGRTAFPETSKKPGVYLIKENGKLVYVGFSSTDLYKTLYRHFQEWTDKHYKTHKVRSASDRVTYKSRMKRNRYTVRIVFCTAAQAERLEKLLIIRHNPRDNEVKYESYKITSNDQYLAAMYATGSDFAISPTQLDAPF